MGQFIRLYKDAVPGRLCDEVIHSFDRSSSLTEGRIGDGVDREKKRSSDLDLAAAHSTLARELAAHLFPPLVDYVSNFPTLVSGAIVAKEALPSGELREVTLDEIAEDRSNRRAASLLQACYSLNELTVQMYRIGEGHFAHWHSEIYPRGQDTETLRRVLFLILYLNTVHEGGATEFLYQRVSVPPVKGSLLVAPAGFTHTHTGNVPTSGSKYVVTSWVSFRRD
jgi:hypothetical protein